MLRLPPSMFCTASTTSVKNCTSFVFFLPTMMGLCRLKCTRVIVSRFPPVCRIACLMFEKIMSTFSSLGLVYRKPLSWHSSVPATFRPLPVRAAAGRIHTSRSASMRPCER